MTLFMIFLESNLILCKHLQALYHAVFSTSSLYCSHGITASYQHITRYQFSSFTEPQSCLPGPHLQRVLCETVWRVAALAVHPCTLGQRPAISGKAKIINDDNITIFMLQGLYALYQRYQYSSTVHHQYVNVCQVCCRFQQSNLIHHPMEYLIVALLCSQEFFFQNPPQGPINSTKNHHPSPTLAPVCWWLNLSLQNQKVTQDIQWVPKPSTEKEWKRNPKPNCVVAPKKNVTFDTQNALSSRYARISLLLGLKLSTVSERLRTHLRLSHERIYESSRSVLELDFRVGRGYVVSIHRKPLCHICLGGSNNEEKSQISRSTDDVHRCSINYIDSNTVIIHQQHQSLIKNRAVQRVPGIRVQVQEWGSFRQTRWMQRSRSFWQVCLKFLSSAVFPTNVTQKKLNGNGGIMAIMAIMASRIVFHTCNRLQPVELMPDPSFWTLPRVPCSAPKSSKSLEGCHPQQLDEGRTAASSTWHIQGTECCSVLSMLGKWTSETDVSHHYKIPSINIIRLCNRHAGILHHKFAQTPHIQ